MLDCANSPVSGEELGLPQLVQASIVASALALVMVGKLMFTSLFARCAPPEGELPSQNRGLTASSLLAARLGGRTG